MTTRTTYYAAYDETAIYGIGRTENEAIEDALQGAGYRSMDDLIADGNSGFQVMPIETGYAEEILRDGFNREAFDTSGQVITRWEDGTMATISICHNEDDATDPNHRRVRLTLERTDGRLEWVTDSGEHTEVGGATFAEAMDAARVAWGDDCWDMREED